MKRIFILLAALTSITLHSTIFASANLVNSIAPMLKNVMPAIVNVRVEGEIENNSNGKNPLRNGPIPPTQPILQLGSGVIIDSDKGYILTNAHVLKNQQQITVTLSDSRHFPAKLIGLDNLSDVAVIQIKADHLTSLALGNSDDLQVGDFVAAIGSPFGLSKTVTSGIVSALQRNDLNIEGLENFIQTDAAINPGNSGGALVTFDGKLVGINTAIIAPAGGNVGIGFAIPINMAYSVMEQLIKYGEVHRGLLGVFAQPLSPDLAQALDLPKNTNGTVITSIAPDSPAALADLKVGDVILKINGQVVQDPYQIRNIIGLLRVGSVIRLDVLRDGKTIKTKATITDSADQLKQMQETQPFLSGVSLSDVNNIQSFTHGAINGGVQVLNVASSTPADQAGLMPGDIIVSANKLPVKNIEDLYNAAKTSKKDLLLNVIRGPGALFIVVK